MKKYELFKELEKGKYEYEMKSYHVVNEIEEETRFYCIVFINESEKKLGRELEIYENDFFLLSEKSETTVSVYMCEDFTEDIYGMFWNFIKTGRIMTKNERI